MASEQRAAVKVDIALQGGGSHGAFTWGVLSRLLEEDWLDIQGVSGTSAGAMNAVALVQGLLEGGNPRAQELLEKYWMDVSRAARLSPIRRGPLDRFLGRWSLDYSPTYLASEIFGRLLSPYQLNPANVNPLRDIVAKCFDFDLVNGSEDIKLFLCATNVRTGRPKIFRQPDISVDTVMASACLPKLFKAVEIDGEAYWDGGYMGNPPLFPLIDETTARDVILVQINPFERDEIPTTAAEIDNRLNEITFNSSLVKELRALGFLWEIIHHENLDREAYRDSRLHVIGAERDLCGLGASSKLNAEEAFLRHLFDIGHKAASDWLDENAAHIGVQSTWTPQPLWEESLEPAHLEPGTKRKLPL
ncbi:MULTISPECIES: patatin-like phospholipase family protein [Ruegeria]|uniref:patatin-like phospholipase family protein n=1 Tax=Ruegeria TaxID=97050 RepID=UPI00147C4B0B|nr:MULTISPECIES: patatin-like phospholipase family protein [Ruegeria]MBY6082753.1 patatin-like phospholipase family protein [Ruegeria arenilitoris]UWR08362.1 patatin-like phospholipase family protein [Ruegeria sp. B32]